MKSFRLVVFFCSVIFLLPCHQEVSAFWALGHSAVAQIAMNNVNESVRNCTNEMFRFLRESGGFSGFVDIIDGSSFADQLNQYINATEPWHFIDKPVNPWNVSEEPGVCVENPINLASTLPKFISSIKAGNPPLIQAFSLAWVVHQLGDVHQPLHAAALLTPEWRDGDWGGNRIRVWADRRDGLYVNRCPSVVCKTNLHKMYDSLCFQDLPDIQLPLALNSTHRAFVENYSSTLEERWASSIPDAERKISNGYQMAMSSWKLAKEIVYGFPNYTAQEIIQDNVTLPPWYQARCIPVMERQIVLAGLRLANILNSIMGTRDPASFAATWPFPAAAASITMNTTAPQSSGRIATEDVGLFLGGFAAALLLVGVAHFVQYWINRKQSARRDGEYEVVESSGDDMRDSHKM